MHWIWQGGCPVLGEDFTCHRSCVQRERGESLDPSSENQCLVEPATQHKGRALSSLQEWRRVSLKQEAKNVSTHSGYQQQ